MKKVPDIFETILTLLIAALGIFALKVIFDNDSSKIVSEEGRQILENEEKMKEVSKKILDSEKEGPYREVVIS
ncbi:hypothetical protein [uncultured Draconibacterium sp.]|uniref:hypothetical protein n=1 Tax=uncultured Draconibacterium sp. TaxID=1573823 RepID=UPI0029C7256D|nr:hypothetical protein [uncultured Draconibacterium sp.]